MTEVKAVALTACMIFGLILGGIEFGVDPPFVLHPLLSVFSR